jgi:hypothetical protein
MRRSAAAVHIFSVGSFEGGQALLKAARPCILRMRLSGSLPLQAPRLSCRAAVRNAGGRGQAPAPKGVEAPDGRGAFGQWILASGRSKGHVAQMKFK